MSALDVATKYKFEGIGKASATAALAALASNPGTVWATQGLFGSLFFPALAWISSMCASAGVVFLNVGVDTVITMVRKGNFDGRMETAIQAVEAGNVAPAQGKILDDSVIEAHNEFGSLTDSSSS